MSTLADYLRQTNRFTVTFIRKAFTTFGKLYNFYNLRMPIICDLQLEVCSSSVRVNILKSLCTVRKKCFVVYSISDKSMHIINSKNML